MKSKGAEIARRHRERRAADLDRGRNYLERKKRERLEIRSSMSTVRERKGQKERNGEREKVKLEPEAEPVLCYSQRHHPAPLQLLQLLEISMNQGLPG